MRGKWVAAGLLAAAALACALPARAGDTVRLNQVQDVPAQRLVDNGQGADTVPVWHRGFGGFGGYRGFGGFGGYRGFGCYRGIGGYGLGYRGFGYGLGGLGLGYRGLGYGLGGLGLGYRGLGFGGYRGFGYGLGGYGLGGYGLGGYGLGGYGLGGYGLGGYGLGGFGYPGIGMGYWGCSGTVGSTVTLGITGPVAAQVIPEGPVAPGVGTVVPGEETYPYDGGPIPPAQPQVTPEQVTHPAAPAPPTERAISLPKRTKKLAYPAYGEKPQRKALSGSTLLTRDR